MLTSRWDGELPGHLQGVLGQVDRRDLEAALGQLDAVDADAAADLEQLLTPPVQRFEQLRRW